MKNTNRTPQQQRRVYAGWFARRTVLAVADIIVAYLAFFFALAIRFVANHRFVEEAGKYLKTFYSFSPHYIVMTFCVFLVFGLYTNRWKFAGFYDAVRIILAHAVLIVLNYAVTRIFFIRMPLSFYFLGTAIQFTATFIIRFSYRILDSFLRYIRRGGAGAVSVMLVGIGDTADYVRKRIESYGDSGVSVACIFSSGSAIPDGRINGVPVVKDEEKLEQYLRKYNLGAIYIADPDISAEKKQMFRELCEVNGIEFQNYSDALQIDPHRLYLSGLLNYADCPVSISVGAETRDFPSGGDALTALQGSYTVSSVKAEGGRLAVTANPRSVKINDTDAAWARETEEETGAPVSFF